MTAEDAQEAIFTVVLEVGRQHTVATSEANHTLRVGKEINSEILIAYLIGKIEIECEVTLKVYSPCDRLVAITIVCHILFWC
jgi:hypothetical protein